MNKDYIGLKAWDMGFDAHLTLLYCGTIDEDKMDKIKFFFYANPYYLRTPIYVTRMGLEGFGYKAKLPVVRVHGDPDLYELHDSLKKLLEVEVEGEWMPHITLKFNHINTVSIPAMIKLNEPYMKLGEVKHTIL